MEPGHVRPVRGRIGGEQGAPIKRLVLAGAAVVAALPFCATQASAAPAKQRATPARMLDKAERPLILGGLPASPGSFGMMAFVAYEDPDTGDLSVCSGTV